MLKLSFTHLNLRYNPFGELTPADRALLAVTDTEKLLPLFNSKKNAIQFIGDSGSGKSTHLLAFNRFLPNAHFIKVNEGILPKKFQSKTLLIDEMQFLSRKSRQRLLTIADNIAFTTHVDFSGELENAGFTLLTIKPAELLTHQHLQAIFMKRIEAARRNPGPLPSISEKTLSWLHKNFKFDIQAMESWLYSKFQNLEGVADV